MKEWKKLIVFSVLIVGAILFILEPFNHRNSSVDAYLGKFNNADVLVLGSSHSYCNINAATMWKENGIACSFIGQSEQPISMSYFMLKSALRQGTPKLVVMEVYMAAVGTNESYDRAPGQYINALLGFPLYTNLDCRIEATQNIEVEYKLPYALGFPNFATDYKSILNGGDDNAGSYFLTRYDKNDQWDSRFSTGMISERGELSEYTKKYLQKIIDLCNEKNVSLLCVVTPYQMSKEHAENINTASDIIESNKIEFVDMNNYVDEMGIDLTNEMVNWGHTFISASDKASRWLASYIVNNYNITDQRKNIEYSQWNEVYDNYLQFKKEAINTLDFATCIRLADYDDKINYYLCMNESSKNVLLDNRDLLNSLPDTFVQRLDTGILHYFYNKEKGKEYIDENVIIDIDESIDYDIALVAYDENMNILGINKWNIEQICAD